MVRQRDRVEPSASRLRRERPRRQSAVARKAVDVKVRTQHAEALIDGWRGRDPTLADRAKHEPSHPQECNCHPDAAHRTKMPTMRGQIATALLKIASPLPTVMIWCAIVRRTARSCGSVTAFRKNAKTMTAFQING